MTFTPEEKLREVEREIAQRRRVYPRMVEAGKLKPSDADARMAIMQEIANDYCALAGAGTLFSRKEP